MGKIKKKSVKFDTKKIIELFGDIETIYKPLDFFCCVSTFLNKNYMGLKFTAFKHDYSTPFIHKILDSKFTDETFLLFNQMKKSELKKIGLFHLYDTKYFFSVKGKDGLVKYILVFDNISNDYIEDVELLCLWMQSLYRLANTNYDRGFGYSMIQNANLVSQICHDFNSLIALIKKHDIKNDKNLQNRIEYSKKMTSDILLYVREFELLKSKVNLIKLMESIIQKMSLPQNIKIEFKAAKLKDEIEVDVELFDRAINEVIENSIMMYGNKQNIITIEIGKESSRSLFVNNKWYVIRVIDYGSGIPRDFLSFATNPFFTTMKSENHNGLGLSIAQKIVNEHGGYLDIYSESGKQTIVSLFLPA